MAGQLQCKQFGTLIGFWSNPGRVILLFAVFSCLKPAKEVTILAKLKMGVGEILFGTGEKYWVRVNQCD